MGRNMIIILIRYVTPFFSGSLRVPVLSGYERGCLEIGRDERCFISRRLKDFWDWLNEREFRNHTFTAGRSGKMKKRKEDFSRGLLI